LPWPGHINVGVEVEFFAAYFHNIFFGCQTGVQLSIAKLDQIRQSRFIGVPIATTTVLEFCYFYRTLSTRTYTEAKQEQREGGMLKYTHYKKSCERIKPDAC
jgi:hypothetical protein